MEEDYMDDGDCAYCGGEGLTPADEDSDYDRRNCWACGGTGVAGD